MSGKEMQSEVESALAAGAAQYRAEVVKEAGALYAEATRQEAAGDHHAAMVARRAGDNRLSATDF